MAFEPQSIANKVKTLTQQVGGAALHHLFPHDIEYYYIALELVNSRGQSVEFFGFPILPSNIQETKPEIKNIKKSGGGVTVLKTSNFIPRDILLQGNFGRQFKFLLGGELIDFAALSFSSQTGNFGSNVVSGIKQTFQQLDPKIKSGYGCIKILESIINKSQDLDENGESYRLYLYNPVLGNNYLVEVLSSSFSMNENEANRIPHYNVSLKAIAPLDQITTRDNYENSLLRNLSFDLITKGVNRVGNNLKRSLGL